MSKLAKFCMSVWLLVVATSSALIATWAAARADPEQDKYVQWQAKYIRQCISKKAVADVRRGDILIAIQRESAGRIQPIAILRNGTLLTSSDSENGTGQEIEHFDALYDLRTGEKHRIEHHADFDPTVTGCFWFGKFKDSKISVAERKKAGRWVEGGNLLTIMASQPLPLRFSVTSEETDIFYRALRPGSCAILNPDVPENLLPPCEVPRVYAISDLNHDGHIQYWYDIPYAWDVGFGVAEIVDGKLKPVHEICPGCSD